MSITYYLDRLKKGSLTVVESDACLDAILTGTVSQPDIEQLLMVLSDRGETVDEIVGFAQAMRRHMVRVPLSFSYCLDLCGTGGSGKDRFNVSTATAFIVSAMGYPVAKHGNYGSRRPNGSFNFLDALGVSYELSVDALVTQFSQTNLCFLLAKNFHPAMRFVMPARKAVNRRTIFNVLGPLCNPASVTHQVIGTSSVTNAQTLAHVVQRLGTTRTVVVVGGDGRDELSLIGPNTIFEVSGDDVKQWTWESPISVTVTEFGDATQNAALFLELIRTQNNDHPIMKYILANVGLALYCIGKVASIDDGIDNALRWFNSNKIDLKKYGVPHNGVPHNGV
jgi:anthranilate phosphoribosyltransferase